MTSTITSLPTPSKHHSTCAWCAESFDTIVDLIDHVDQAHLHDRGMAEHRRVA